MKFKRLVSAVLSAAVFAVSLPLDLFAVHAQDITAETASVTMVNVETEEGIFYVSVKNGKAAIENFRFLKSGISEFYIPEEIEGYPVTELGEGAFSCVNEAEGIVVPESVEKINERTFYTDYKNSLKWVRFENADMIIPDNQETVGPYIGRIYGKENSTAQRYAQKYMINFIDYEKVVKYGSLTGYAEDGTVRITECDKSETEVVIPEEINGMPVTAIERNVFSGFTELTGVYIPDSVKTIENYTFSGCTNLTEVRLPEGLERIPYSCFGNCESLSECHIPDTVTSIDSYAFSGCTSLESVNIPDNLSYAGDNAFLSTPWLSEQTDENNLAAANGVLFDGHGFEGEDLVIPDGIKIICCNAFNGMENIKTVLLPDSITGIGNDAFNGCSNLNSVNLPDSLTEFGYGVFENCPLITEISIPEKIIHVSPSLFKGCTGLKEVRLPEGVKEIFSNAFDGCENLELINFPDSLENIGSYAFRNCSSLVSAGFSDSLEVIRSNAFYNCTSLSEITFPPDKYIELDLYAFTGTAWLEKQRSENELVIINNMLLDGTQCTGDIVIPDGITVICGSAFKDSEITSVTLPDSVQKFGYSAFNGCRNLTEFTIPDGVTEIAGSMFFSCTSLKKVNIPESVTAIGGGAFEFCDGFTEFTVPKHIKSLGMAFDYCDNLKTITIENPDCFISPDSENFFTMPFSTVVRGYADSTAYWYAYYSGRTFETIIVSGDANADLTFSSADLVMLQQYLSKAGKLTAWENCDLNEDNVVDVFDLVLARKKLLSDEN